MFKFCMILISDVYSEVGIHSKPPDKETYLKILTDGAEKPKSDDMINCSSVI